MANLKELRGRIKSVASIAQITRAMEMVASMKLRKVQAKALGFHPYTMEVRGMLERLSGRVGEGADLPLFRGREVKTTAFLVITSDRGLCGSYNSNLLNDLRKTIAAIKQQDPERKLVFFCYGRKGFAWLTRRGYQVARFFVDPPLDKADFNAARITGQALVDAFTAAGDTAGVVDEVRLCYTRFQSVSRFVPTMQPFLPVQGVKVGDAAASPYQLDFLMEPDPVTVFNRLIPRYLETVIFDAMLQALASEQASRRMAMKSATDAAARMSKSLKKVYNRARQENITKELLDIVGGASAVS